ncbi:hypothetical protein AVU38_gp166 [Ralstonia phage RSL2]|uniref:hypothetical protein n=1 Tax=Ralstonia phage RSL2 TaxID=1585840 RepID=UPI00054A805C|nr:hypothetical protein AVU38_gp166 [Ralstonia phage RSL2]
MPKIQRPILESDQSVSRAIAVATVQEILIDRLGLPANMNINYPGYADTVAQPHGYISNKYETIRLPSTDKIFIEITENYVNDWLPAMVTKQPEQIPLFLNRDLEIEMRPIYASVEMKFSIHYRAKNKTDARRWYDYMIMKIPNREDTWLHTLQYSFAMPESYMVILKELWSLQEAVAGYGEDFDTFFQKWVNPRYGLLTDQAGKNTLGVFKDTQMRCLGFFDIGSEPDFGQRKDETDVWEVEIPYVLRYEKPKDIHFMYPISVHNQILDKKFRNQEGFQRLEDHQQSRSWSMAHLKSFEAMNDINQVWRDFPGRYFPTFDEFMPRNVPERTMRMVTTLVLLPTDEQVAAGMDPNLLMNLTDLEADSYGFQFSDCMKQFMASEAQYVTKPRQSAVNVALYMGRLLADPSWIRMDENLNVYSTQPLNKRKVWHLRVSVTTDLTYITEDAKARLRNSPCAFEQIVQYIAPTTAGNYRPCDNILANGLTPRSYDAFAECLKGRTINRAMKTVQFSTVNGVFKSKN